MNRSTKSRNYFTLITLGALSLLLSGCGGAFSYSKHTTVRAPELRGRILDAKTHQPIEGAKVYFCEPPEHLVFTDTNGCFFMKAAINIHTGRDAAGGSSPPRKSDSVCISKEGYRTRSFLQRYDGDPMSIQLEPTP
jgi:hypothetical protein